MACFLVPTTEAIVTTVVQKVVSSKEKREGIEHPETDIPMVKLSEKLGWLNKMLWGGSALLAFEHIWHGEVIPTFPFLTAIQNGETADMLAEMGTAGVGMAVLVTLIWAGIVFAASSLEKRGTSNDEKRGEEA